jgi:DNA-binding XRE family transcriptional regulator
MPAVNQPTEDMTGRDLKEWRERLNLTQAEAAAAIGCSRRAIQAWEAKPDKIVPKWLAMAVGAVSYGLPPYR